MAVYTEVAAETLAAFLADYPVGPPVMAKGIAEGVSNSNYLVETGPSADGAPRRFILTLYERRVDAASLPYVLDLMTHLADRGLPVPRPVPDRAGRTLKCLLGRPASLIAFLPGVSVSEPTPAHCRAVGEAMARLHLAAESYPGRRANPLGPESWRALLAALDLRLDRIEPGLAGLAAHALDRTAGAGQDLPAGIIHADLFPDNVLFLGSSVSGLIDFAFAGEDALAFDLAVAETAWAFSEDGRSFDPARAAALRAGYESVRPLAPNEKAALPRLACGAALRFLLTRAEDWLARTEGGPPLVRPKDPLAFARRLRHYLAALP